MNTNHEGEQSVILETAPTQFIEAGGVKFAYRGFGKSTGQTPDNVAQMSTSSFLTGR